MKRPLTTFQGSSMSYPTPEPTDPATGSLKSRHHVPPAVEPDRPQGLISSLRDLSQKPDLPDDIGCHGLEYVLRFYLGDQQAKRLEEILTAAASRSFSG
jgi:hypothetical protein